MKEHFRLYSVKEKIVETVSSILKILDTTVRAALASFVQNAQIETGYTKKRTQKTKKGRYADAKPAGKN